MSCAPDPLAARTGAELMQTLRRFREWGGPTVAKLDSDGYRPLRTPGPALAAEAGDR